MIRARIEEEENTVSAYIPDINPWAVAIPMLVGAGLGFWAGGKWPGAMTRIYGMGLGAGLAYLGVSLVYQFTRST